MTTTAREMLERLLLTVQQLSQIELADDANTDREVEKALQVLANIQNELSANPGETIQ